MNRRNFLTRLGIGAVALPLAAKAISGSGYADEQHRLEIDKAMHESFFQPIPPLKQMQYRCVVGGYETSANGHKYTRAAWESMFRNPKSGALVVFENPMVGHGNVINLDLIAGRIEWSDLLTPVLDKDEHFQYMVSIIVRLLDTPCGKTIKSMLDERCDLFVTPVGVGNIMDDVVTNYQFSHFNVTTDSAFDCATPLRPLYWRSNQNSVL